MAAVTTCSDFEAPKNKSLPLFPLFPHLFAMKWWDRMPWSSLSECWALSQLFHSPLSLSPRGFFFATLWTVACQAPLSIGFSRQEYWNGLPLPSPADHPDPGIKPVSPALQEDSLLLSHPGKPVLYYTSTFWVIILNCSTSKVSKLEDNFPHLHLPLPPSLLQILFNVYNLPSTSWKWGMQQ